MVRRQVLEGRALFLGGLQFQVLEDLQKQAGVHFAPLGSVEAYLVIVLVIPALVVLSPALSVGFGTTAAAIAVSAAIGRIADWNAGN